jgi:hypothetical protein
MESEVSSLCLQNPVIGLYHEPDSYSQYPHTLFLKCILILFLRLCLPSKVFEVKYSCVFKYFYVLYPYGSLLFYINNIIWRRVKILKRFITKAFASFFLSGQNTLVRNQFCILQSVALTRERSDPTCRNLP